MSYSPIMQEQEYKVYTAEPRTQGFGAYGSWAGKVPDDKENPLVENSKEPPKIGTAQQLELLSSEQKERFQDVDPIHKLIKEANEGADKNIAQQQERARAILGADEKNILVRSLEDRFTALYAVDPFRQTQDELVKTANEVQELTQETLSDWQASLLRMYASRLSKALRKAIYTKPAEEKEAEQAPPKAKAAAKAQTKIVTDRGKVGYKYQKLGSGKGPNSDGWLKGTQPETSIRPDGAAARKLQPSIDFSPLLSLLGISQATLQKFADSKAKDDFVRHFLRPELMERGVDARYLNRVYDALMQIAPQSMPDTAKEGDRGPLAPRPTRALPRLPHVAKAFVRFADLNQVPKPYRLEMMCKSLYSVPEICSIIGRVSGMSYEGCHVLLHRWINRGWASVELKK